MTFTECQNKIYIRGDGTRMGAEVNFPGVIIAGLLAVLLQYLDSSFILTIHIILFIMGFF